MKNLNILLVSLIVFTQISCKSLKYQADIGDMIIPSGYAQSPEFPISVNGKPCKDVDNIMGFCTIRVKSNQNLRITLANRPYDYRLKIKTSTNITFATISKEVLKNTNEEIIIPFDTYNGQNVFNIQGEVFPNDRPEPISAMFDIRVRIIREDYLASTNPYLDIEKNVFVFGLNALHSDMKFSNNLWEYNNKKVYIENKKPCFVITETERMRFAYYYGNC